MRIQKIILLTLILALATLIYPPKIKAANSTFTNPTYEIKVSATIGEPKLTIFGYSSPNSLVKLEGNRVSEQTIADQTGYFLFDRVFLPNPDPKYPELCLSAIDTQSRISFPTCLPELPLGLYLSEIGPVLLPPTISLEKGVFLSNEQIKATGATLPNSKVNIFLANDNTQTEKSFWSFELVSKAEAYSIPQYQIISDETGHFEFNLPSQKQADWKMFAGSQLNQSPTPKSNTLTFAIVPWWQWFLSQLLKAFIAFLRLLKPSFWLIILVELLIVVFLTKEHRKAKQARIKARAESNNK